MPGGPSVEPRIWLARALSATDRLDEAQGHCEDVLCEIAEHGNVAMLPAAHAVRARVLLVRGQLGVAVTEAQAGVVAAESTGVTQASPELLAMLAFLAAVRGHEEMAGQATDRCAGLVAGGIADGGHLALLRATASLNGCRALVDSGSLLFRWALTPGATDVPGIEQVIAVTGADGKAATLEPYLGAFGHLVVMRQGDLAYVHVHPETQLADGKVKFWLSVPSGGSYRMFFDYQVAGRVHTAAWTFTVG